MAKATAILTVEGFKSTLELVDKMGINYKVIVTKYSRQIIAGGINYKLITGTPPKPVKPGVMGEAKCSSCGINKGVKAHGCPYKEEITGCKDKCNCCDSCEQECAHDV